jgi:hypothetical protein
MIDLTLAFISPPEQATIRTESHHSSSHKNASADFLNPLNNLPPQILRSAPVEC